MVPMNCARPVQKQSWPVKLIGTHFTISSQRVSPARRMGNKSLPYTFLGSSFRKQSLQRFFARAVPMFLILVHHALGNPVTRSHRIKLCLQIRTAGGGGRPVNARFRAGGLALGRVMRGRRGCYNTVHRLILHGFHFLPFRFLFDSISRTGVCPLFAIGLSRVTYSRNISKS